MNRPSTWWLIDGYNLLFRWSGCPTDPRQLATRRHELLRAIERWADMNRDRVTVVFDSRSEVPLPPLGNFSVEVRFARPGLGADAWIEHAVRTCSKQTHCQVVSSDHHVRRNVEVAGASCMSCEEFVRVLRSRSGRSRPPPNPGPSLGDLFPQLKEHGTNPDYDQS